MRYGVLGTVEVHGESGRVDLGGTQQRRLLAVFLSSPGQVFSVDRLIDALWQDGLAPSGAGRAVLTYVSRLRTSIERVAMVTRDGGYVFDLNGSTIDAVEFEDLLRGARAADPDAAVALYDSAIGLWRGRAFGEFSTEWWAIAPAARLEELRAVANEERAAAMIALGQRARAVAELEALLAEHPLRERSAQLLMQALAGEGRKSDALRVFHSFRETLIDETGLGPSLELVELERAIATNDRRSAAVDGRPLRGYVLHEAIGRGAHGTVYAARQPGTDRDVAVKVIRAEFADSAEFVRRFEIEAQFVARLEHPHIVPLYDFWREPGGAYLVFRLLRGGTAHDSLVTGGRWSLDRVSGLVEEVGGAMMTAHAAGVAHRDIGPANILLDDDGNMFIADFGIAVEQRTDSPGTSTDILSDVRDFAITIWELLAGSPPAMPGWRGSLPTLLERLPDLPAAVDAVLTRASSPERDGGFHSMAELILAWRAAIGRLEGIPGRLGGDGVRTSSDRRLAARQLSARAQAGVNPYRGLRPFGEADARDFFGRTQVALTLRSAVDAARFIAIVGPSGAGKSSLVHAGLMPMIREQDTLLVAAMTPGEHPLSNLHAALTLVSRTPLDASDPEAAVRAVAHESQTGLLLIIDQFEECWTLADTSEREQFLALVTASVNTGEGPPVSVIVTVRADMYDRPLQHPLIGPLIGEHTFPLTPMSAAELEDAVQLPAARAHVEFEDGVVSSIVTETAANPASLPLLQFTLFELFEQRVDGRIGAAAYAAIGGIAGAIAGRAEQLYSRSSADDQEHIRLLFGRLVTPGQGTPDSRRRTLMSDLSVPARTVATKFVTARLLVTDHDPVTREPTIEVAHEAILTRWSRLSEWIEADRRWLAQLHHLSGAARAWDHAGRPDSELYRGSRLEAALEELLARKEQLTDNEIRFIGAGRSVRDFELERQRRSTRRLRRSLAGVAVLLVLAVVSASVAALQRRTADRKTRDARIGALVGDIASIRATEHDTAALLAIEAYRLANTPATRSALLSTFTSSPGLLDTHRLGDDGTLFAGAVLPNDGRAFIVGPDNLVHPYDMPTGRIGEAFPRALPASTVANYTGAPFHPGSAAISMLVPSPDGKVLAQLDGARDPNGDGATTHVALFDVASGRPLADPVQVELSAGTLTFSPDAKEFVVSGGFDGTAVAFDSATGKELGRLTGRPPEEALANQVWQTAGLAFLDANHLAVGSVDDTIRIVDPATLEQIGDPITVPVNTTSTLFALDDGATLLGAGLNGIIRVDVATSEIIWQFGVGAVAVHGCNRLIVVAERSRFFCADSFGGLDEHDLADGSLIKQLDTQNGAVASLWSTRDGTELVSFGDNEPFVSRQRLDGSGAISRRIDPGLAGYQYSPDGKLLIATQLMGSHLNDNVPGSFVLVDPSTGNIAERLGALFAAFWNADNTLGGVTIEADGLQLARYELASHRLVQIDYTFTRQIDRNVTNAGQPRAWISLPNGDDTWEIWTFERPSGRRVEPTLTIKSLVGLTGSPDGSRIAVSLTTGVVVFDGRTGAEIARIDNRPDLRGVYFVTNDLIAISSLGGELTLHDVDTLATIRTLNGSRGFIDDIQPTLDGSVIAAKGGDSNVQLIDVASGTPLGGPIAIPDGEWNGIALQPQGLQLVAGGGAADGMAIWDLDPEHWVDAACRLAGRNLTTEEWDTYLGGLAPYHKTCS